ERADDHDVYFGTNMTAVMNATTASPEFRGNRTTTTFNPGTLARATTYYWRIDEVNDAGTTAGDLWSFTTVPDVVAKASNPTPANNATGQLVNVLPELPARTVLSWTAGAGTGPITHDVYLGTSENDVMAANKNSPEFMGNQGGTTFDPGALSPFFNSYWRIDEVNPGGTQAGDVWTFQTAAAPGAPTNPSPADAAQNVDVGDVNTNTSPTLTWSAGSNTTSHDVYFGTTQTSVQNATRTSTQFKGNQAGTSFSTVALSVTDDTQYFWRIDEIGAGGITAGPVWGFRTESRAPTAPIAPNPADTATGIPTSTSLGWSAERAASFKVYFGTSMTDVTNKNASVFRGTVTNESMPNGSIDPLVATTTYYWLVTAVNAAGETDGPVWSFTTP
ncbi:MAG: hypothetical protein V3T70_11665, partial [Phycisphaerae bacterium]